MPCRLLHKKLQELFLSSGSTMLYVDINDVFNLLPDSKSEIETYLQDLMNLGFIKISKNHVALTETGRLADIVFDDVISPTAASAVYQTTA